MAIERDEKGGFWFSTKNGTHIYVEPGQSKEEAIYKKFATKEQKSERAYEPLGGFDSETTYTTRYYSKREDDYYYDQNTKPKVNEGFYGKWATPRGWEDNEKEPDITHNGETGKVSEMYKKYGRTAEEVLRDKPITKADKEVQNDLKESIRDYFKWGEDGQRFDKKYGLTPRKINMPDGYTHTTNFNYTEQRRKIGDRPAFTEKLYSSQGNQIAEIDSTGKYSGKITDVMQTYKVNSDEQNVRVAEERYISTYYKGSNFNPNFKSGSTPKSREELAKKQYGIEIYNKFDKKERQEGIQKIYKTPEYKAAVERNKPATKPASKPNNTKKKK